jgi:ATP-dependent DNA helicase RecQ
MPNIIFFKSQSHFRKWLEKHHAAKARAHRNRTAERAAKDSKRRPIPRWVTAIPSRRHPRLVYDFASRLADALEIPFVEALKRTREAAEQKTMANSSMQARNVKETPDAINEVTSGAVLLVDDIIDSGWTLTLAGWLLRRRGSGVVHPFTLARATARKS